MFILLQRITQPASQTLICLRFGRTHQPHRPLEGERRSTRIAYWPGQLSPDRGHPPPAPTPCRSSGHAGQAAPSILTMLLSTCTLFSGPVHIHFNGGHCSNNIQLLLCVVFCFCFLNDQNLDRIARSGGKRWPAYWPFALCGFVYCLLLCYVLATSKVV